MSNREPGWYWTRWIVDGPWVPVRWYCSPDGEEMWIARSVGEYPIEVGPRIQPPGELDEAIVERVARIISPQSWAHLNAGEEEREKATARRVIAAIGSGAGRDAVIEAATDLYRATKLLLSAVDHLAGHLGQGWQSQDASREGQDACDFAEIALAKADHALASPEKVPAPIPEPTAEQTAYFRDLAARHVPYDPAAHTCSKCGLSGTESILDCHVCIDDQPNEDIVPTPPAASDLLSDLVTRFSAALLDKLRAAEEKYGWENGWTETGWEADCQQALLKHLAKGDPRDVAAYCAFLWHHGSPTVAAVPAASDLRERAMVLITKLQGGEPCDPNDDDIEPIVAAFAAIRAEASAEGGVISLDAIDGPSPTEQESHHSERLQRRNSKL